MRKAILLAMLFVLGACITLSLGDTQVSYVQWAEHYRVCDRRPAITKEEIPFIDFIPGFGDVSISNLRAYIDRYGPIRSASQLYGISAIDTVKVNMLLALYNLAGAAQPTITPPCGYETEQPSLPAEERALFVAKVVEVIDGDTIDVQLADGREERVRYIGMDTPEIHGPVECYGQEASAYNDRLVGGKTVWLELDVEERDRYQRLLAYVYLDSDGQAMVNAILLSQGYAQVMTVPPNVKYAARFLKLQQEAREAGRGLWGACP
jgi:endonuclease YncB( thermonuclease family)